MSLLELLIAMVVLSIGIMGGMAMVVVGMKTNSRSKTDTTATVLDQEILEEFATLKQYPKPGFVTIYDCAPGAADAHEASLGVGAGPTGAGAALYQSFPPAPSADKVYDVDWTQAAPVFATAAVQGYAMQYQACSGDIYEVRWNVMAISPNPNSRMSLLTVSARQQLAVSGNQAVLYSRPTTLHALIENF